MTMHKNDEPSFTLWASDPRASSLVRDWATGGMRDLAQTAMTSGRALTPDDQKPYLDAFTLAGVMDAWRRANGV